MQRERRVLTPAEVAEKFRVDPKTISRYADEGRLPFFRTPGGHRRFYEDEIEALMQSSGTPAEA